LYLCIDDKLYCILTERPLPLYHSKTTGSPERTLVIAMPDKRRIGKSEKGETLGHRPAMLES
jgi:hypothetical protein